MTKTKTERRPDLVRQGQRFILSHLGFKEHDYDFLGKVSRLIRNLEVSAIEPAMDERHLSIKLTSEISKLRLDELLEKYRISNDYDEHGSETIAMLHNGGDFYVYVRPVRFDK